jgi:hypothetical protein
MNTDTMTDDISDDDLIADSVARLFGDQVDKAARERAETGVFDRALWQQVVDAGLPLMLASDAAGGLGQDLAAAYPVLRGPGPLAGALAAGRDDAGGAAAVAGRPAGAGSGRRAR